VPATQAGGGGLADSCAPSRSSRRRRLQIAVHDRVRSSNSNFISTPSSGRRRRHQLDLARARSPNRPVSGRELAPGGGRGPAPLGTNQVSRGLARRAARSGWARLNLLNSFASCQWSGRGGAHLGQAAARAPHEELRHRGRQGARPVFAVGPIVCRRTPSSRRPTFEPISFDGPNRSICTTSARLGSLMNFAPVNFIIRTLQRPSAPSASSRARRR
jgi:hypothetical protein